MTEPSERHDVSPRVVARFEHRQSLDRAVAALLAAGIPSAHIRPAAPRAGWLTVRAPGRSDRHFTLETLREFGADGVRVIVPAGSAAEA